MTTHELAPGIHEVASDLGSRSVRQWLCVGEHVAVIDTGIVGTVPAAILPALEAIGVERDRVTDVLISHADVDHYGGNADLVAAIPGARLRAHPLDAPLISSYARIAAERYGWYRKHGLDYPPAVWEWLEASAGADTPVQGSLAEGSSVELGGITLEVLHLPGHSAGHLGFFEPQSGVAIVADAAMGRGFHARDGRLVGPPPYESVAQYRATAERLLALSPAVLATSHFPVLRGAEIAPFLRGTLAFVDDLEAELDRELAAGPATIATLLDRCDAALGPFLELRLELARSIAAHLAER